MLCVVLAIFNICGTFCALTVVRPEISKIFAKLEYCINQHDMNEFGLIIEDAKQQYGIDMFSSFLEAAEYQNAESNAKRNLKFFIDYNYLHHSRAPLPIPFAGSAFWLLYDDKNRMHTKTNYKKNGNTAIHILTQTGETSLVRLYIDANFNLNKQNSLGQTALHFAVDSVNEEYVDLLVNAGADVMLRDTQKKTPLQYAIEKERPTLANKLCQKLPVDAIGHAMVSALNSQNEFIMKQVVHGIHESVRQFEVEILLKKIPRLGEILYSIKTTEKPSLNVKKSDWEYVKCTKNKQGILLIDESWSEKAYAILTTWMHLFQRLFLGRATDIALRQIDGTHRHITVKTITDLYDAVPLSTFSASSTIIPGEEREAMITQMMGGDKLKDCGMKYIVTNNHPDTHEQIFEVFDTDANRKRCVGSNVCSGEPTHGILISRLPNNVQDHTRLHHATKKSDKQVISAFVPVKASVSRPLCTGQLRPPQNTNTGASAKTVSLTNWNDRQTQSRKYQFQPIQMRPHSSTFLSGEQHLELGTVSTNRNDVGPEHNEREPSGARMLPRVPQPRSDLQPTTQGVPAHEQPGLDFT